MQAYSRWRTKSFGQAFMPTPVFMLRALMGEVSDVIGSGQRVLPKRAMELGYAYKYPTVEIALNSIMSEA